MSRIHQFALYRGDEHIATGTAKELAAMRNVTDGYIRLLARTKATTGEGLHATKLEYVIPPTRKCCTCQVVKPLDEFFRDIGQYLGRDYRCKSCAAKLRPAQYLRMKNSEAYKRKQRKKSKKYNKKYPDRERAHRLAKYHKAEIRKSACEECGSVENLHMHHPDYSKPLYVITLCQPCHVNLHRKVAV